MTTSTDAGGAKPVTIIPFADKATSTCISDLIIETRLDRVSLYGSLDLTHDRKGLENARRLQALLEAVVQVLEGEEDQRPDKDQSKPNVPQVRNPFS